MTIHKSDRVLTGIHPEDERSGIPMKISASFAITVEATITGTGIAFVDSGPDTITDTGDGFVDAGFEAGQIIIVSGSTSNDGTYTIDTGGVAAGTLTLIAGDTLIAEDAGDTVTIAVCNVQYGDTIQMFPTFDNMKITDLVFQIPDLGTEACTVDIGDGGDVDRFFDGISVVTAADTFDLAQQGTNTGLLYEYSAADTIDMLIVTGQPMVAGTIKATVEYVVETGVM